MLDTLDIRSAPVEKVNAGDITVVAGVPGFKIAVLHFLFTATTNVDVRWKSDGATFLTGRMRINSGSGTAPFVGPYVHPGNGAILFETLPGEPLVLQLMANATVGGYVVYYLRD